MQCVANGPTEQERRKFIRCVVLGRDVKRYHQWLTGDERLERLSAPVIVHYFCSASLAIWKCALRPGKVHSADGWDGALKPVVERYRSKVSRIYFRADTGFANPDIYWFLQAERIQCAIRLTATRFLQERIGHLLRRPIGPPPNKVRHPMQISFISRQAGQSSAGSSPRSSGIRANFIRTRVVTLAMPEQIKDWSLTGLKEKLIEIGAAGKVLLGPAGNAGSFSVPVRLAILRKSDNDLAVAKLYRASVTLPSDQTNANSRLSRSRSACPLSKITPRTNM